MESQFYVCRFPPTKSRDVGSVPVKNYQIPEAEKHTGEDMKPDDHWLAGGAIASVVLMGCSTNGQTVSQQSYAAAPRHGLQANRQIP